MGQSALKKVASHVSVNDQRNSAKPKSSAAQENNFVSNKAPASKKNAFGYQDNSNLEINEEEELKHRKKLVEKVNLGII